MLLSGSNTTGIDSHPVRIMSPLRSTKGWKIRIPVKRHLPTPPLTKLAPPSSEALVRARELGVMQ